MRKPWRLNAIIIRGAGRGKGRAPEHGGHIPSGIAFGLRRAELYNLIVLRKYSRKAAEKPRWLDYLSERLKAGMDCGLIRPMDPDKAAFFDLESLFWAST
jgi:hypothetical protein